MKMNLLKICLLFCLLQLVSCAAPPKEDPLDRLREPLPDLPGATVSADGLQISYPGNSLFAEGSVLPLPGGMAVLNPLIDFLTAKPELIIAGTVRSAGHSEDYDQLIAGKRHEILRAIFINRGIDERRLQLVQATGEGAPLTIELQSPDDATSSEEK